MLKVSVFKQCFDDLAPSFRACDSIGMIDSNSELSANKIDTYNFRDKLIRCAHNELFELGLNGAGDIASLYKI